MKCEICGQVEPDLVVMLLSEKISGTPEIMACIACARKSKAYCHKHDKPHGAFINNTTSCISCIEELVAANEAVAEDIRNRLMKFLPEGEFKDLSELARFNSSLSGSSESLSILRFIATKSLQSGRTVSDVIWETLMTRSVRSIF